MTPWRTETTAHPSVLVEENYAKHTVLVLDVFKRFLKYTAIGLVATTIVTLTAYEGAHLWVEHVELAPETDEEVRKWQWDLETDKWTGGPAGGTDPGLGFKGRHAVRSAWMAENWGSGSGGNSIGTAKLSGSDAGSLNAIETRLEFAHDFLNVAINIALDRHSQGAVRSRTLTELITRHANIMERMGIKSALVEARSEYGKVWSGLSGKGCDAAKIALKLGDLNTRLGDDNEAIAWWSRAIQVAQKSTASSEPEIPPTVPTTAPPSAWAQRALISTLVSLSAYYARTGQLHDARTVEESSLNLIRTIRQPESLDTSSPPQTLHALYILHRSSILSVHLAEVLWAQKVKLQTSMDWLARAAESSERVALTLAGLPLIHPDAPQSHIPHPPSSETALLPEYAKSRSMAKPAKSLLRDSRRTAAEAWNLMGILYEGIGGAEAQSRALDCYERALGWAGVASDNAGGIGKAGEGTLEKEWNTLWANYVRVRDAVRKHSAAEKKKSS